MYPKCKWQMAVKIEVQARTRSQINWQAVCMVFLIQTHSVMFCILLDFLLYFKGQRKTLITDDRIACFVVIHTRTPCKPAQLIIQNSSSENASSFKKHSTNTLTWGFFMKYLRVDFSFWQWTVYSANILFLWNRHVFKNRDEQITLAEVQTSSRQMEVS